MADLADAPPVSDLEFDGAMAALFPEAPIAVAVSGGADSMALLHLTSRWLCTRPQPSVLIAMTVDHGLRDGSLAEAQQVGAWCRSLGGKHQILAWRGDKPQSDIQAAARRARYSLMGEYCREQGIRSLLLGHQFDDQAETFLLRLGRGSGVDGLAAMAAVVQWNGVRFLRPLLGFSRRRLQATLAARELPWLDDPSNKNPRFARVRARRILPELENAGISAARIVATAQRMRRVRTALERATAQVIRDAVRWDPAGFAAVNLHPVFDAPEEIGLRTLARILMQVGAREYPPRLLYLERLWTWLHTGPLTGGRTLAGCRIIPRKGQILFVREPAAIGPDISLSPGEDALWDNRFRVRLGCAATDHDRAGFVVRAVGSSGLSQMRKGVPGDLPPRIVCQSIPGLWQGPQLLAAPQLGFVVVDSVAASAFEASLVARKGLLLEYIACEGNA